VKNKIFFSIVK